MVVWPAGQFLCCGLSQLPSPGLSHLSEVGWWAGWWLSNREGLSLMSGNWQAVLKATEASGHGSLIPQEASSGFLTRDIVA